MNKNDPITAQEWEQLTYWKRKKLYLLFVWYRTKTKIKKFFMSWTLPNFAIRQIRMAQGSPITVNDESTGKTDTTEELRRLYSLSTREERIEMIALMLAVIEARWAPTAANPDEERQAKQ